MKRANPRRADVLRHRAPIPFLAAAVALASGVWAPASARAQEETAKLRTPEARQGYYLGGGLRTGFIGTFNDVIDPGSFLVFGGAFRFGEMVLPWLGVGGLAQFYGGSNSDYTTFMGSGAIEAQLEPWPERNLAFHLAVGPYFQGVNRIEEELAREDDPDQGYGVLVALGPSYDLFPFRKDDLKSGGFAVSFYLEGQAWLSEDFQTVGAIFGVEIGQYFGLGRQKLDLPLDRAYQ